MKVLVRSHAVAILLGICACVIIFWGLGSTHLTNWDEAWYASVSREMARTGNYLTPIWNKQPFFEKPPMYYWVSALAYRLFGESSFSARFFSAAGSAASVFLVYMLGTLLFGRIAGILSMITLMSTIGFLYRGRTGNMDGFLTALLLASIIAFVNLAQTKRKKLWFGIAAISITASALTKGAIAFVFPILGCLLGFKTWKGNRLYMLATSIALIIFIAWFFGYRAMFGEQFVTQFFSQQTDKVAPSASVVSGFSLEYFGYLKSGMKLWFLLFIPSFVLSWVIWRRTKAFFLLLYVTLFFVFLSFSANKSDWYLTTFYPIYALIIGSVAVWAWKRFLPRFSIVLLVAGFIALAGYQLITYRTLYMPPDVSEGEAGVALAAKNLVPKDTPIYLTHYYFPTATYYSEHLVYAVFSDQIEGNAWWIRAKSQWKTIRELPEVYIIAGKDDLVDLRDTFAPYTLQELFREGDKILMTNSVE